MSIHDELYKELLVRRDALRKEHAYANGREPPICTDEALEEMAERMPAKNDDLLAINGIGQRAVEQYGEEFLSIIRRYSVTAVDGFDLDEKTAQTLRDLQKKLVNISRGNRMLFQPRVGRKTAFDLALSEADALGLVFGRKREVVLCNGKGNKEEQKMFKRLNDILREVNRDIREKGSYDLYIAYPFVEGRLSGDDFPVRAPLALFPATMEKDGQLIRIGLDDGRDAMYNNTLLLAMMKVGRKQRALPDCVIESVDEGTFMTDLIQFYLGQGMELELPADLSLARFTEYRSDCFPGYGQGELHLVTNAVIGKYPTYSSFIQRDFDTLLSGKGINHTLSDLVKEQSEEDFRSEYPLPLTPREIAEKGLCADESELVYVNSLNGSQENVLSAIGKMDGLVVQGPPGTGKSQVITGLISSAVLSGKTVLMVSEKKTALDVVYSRLEGLSKYCLQIDDTADKTRFYRQMETILSLKPTSHGSSVSDLSMKISSCLSELERITSEIYLPGKFGISAAELYEERLAHGCDYDMDLFRERVSPSLLELDNPSLKALSTRYDDPATIRGVKEYYEIMDESPWMQLVRTDLSLYEIDEFKMELERLDRESRGTLNKGFIAKLMSKGKASRDAVTIANRYFSVYNDKTIASITIDPLGIAESMDDYRTFVSRNKFFEGLTVEEKNYGRGIISLSRKLKKAHDEVNRDIYRFILDDHLDKFDRSHRQMLDRLPDFDSTLSVMDSAMAEKRETTMDLAEDILSGELRYITDSKRYQDIARIVDNKRKWSINKFVNRFGYELFKGVRVWLMTPEVVSEILPMEMGMFDLLVFDEASQMYVEKGIPSIYRAKKVVVAGDHRQLRPSSLGTGRLSYDEDDSDEQIGSVLDEESLLDLARARYDNFLLNFHYRSKYEELIAFSNYAFYNGRLHVSPNTEEPEKPPIEMHRVNGLWEDKCNYVEADRVVEVLKEVLRTRSDNETVGIITFNIGQRDLINDRIEEAASKDRSFSNAISKEVRRTDNGEDVGLFVKNIESVQGDERDIIIFSVGYARNSEGKFVQRFGWLNMRGGENRLNVAISRAKKKIHIVSSFEPEELKVEETASVGPKILKKYLQYARAVSNGNKILAQTILSSFLPSGDIGEEIASRHDPAMDLVYDALVGKGYVVDRDIGIGGYTIDMAVRDGDRYVLGIEHDTRLYKESENARERDYHRRKYLESRGWNMVRVWTPNLCRSPEKEISRIISRLEQKNQQNDSVNVMLNNIHGEYCQP
ncbi:MAG: AAA domain-containing protein [archaeon]|nr:AAA domain-containing protein [archaeon]